MLIHERSVTKEYWSATYDYIHRRLDNGRYAKVQGTGVVHVQGGENTTTFAVLHGGSPVAWLNLAKRPSWKAWEVRQVWVFPEVRGQGLAGKIYRAAVNERQLILASGKTQSKSSRALWLSFVKKNTFRIWAQDFNNLDLRSPVWVEDNEIQSRLEIYTRFTTSRDVRLIAIRK